MNHISSLFRRTSFKQASHFVPRASTPVWNNSSGFWTLNARPRHDGGRSRSPGTTSGIDSNLQLIRQTLKFSNIQTLFKLELIQSKKAAPPSLTYWFGSLIPHSVILSLKSGLLCHAIAMRRFTCVESRKAEIEVKWARRRQHWCQSPFKNSTDPTAAKFEQIGVGHLHLSSFPLTEVKTSTFNPKFLFAVALFSPIFFKRFLNGVCA